MIAALLLGIAAAGQATPPPDDIVVTGERLKRIMNLRIVTRRVRRTGATRCFLRPSSGDAALDAGVCTVYLDCVARVATAAALDACMRPPLTALVTARLGAAR